MLDSPRSMVVYIGCENKARWVRWRLYAERSKNRKGYINACTHYQKRHLQLLEKQKASFVKNKRTSTGIRGPGYIVSHQTATSKEQKRRQAKRRD